MRALIQRVQSASVKLYDDRGERTVHSHIDGGMCVLLGVEEYDDERHLDYLVQKIANLRIFSDDEGKMNLSIKDISGSILLVSQFTLCADTRKGNRPSFIRAEKPEIADRMVYRFAEELEKQGIPVKKGVFGADMLVTIENDGPVTIWLDSKDKIPS